MKSKASLKMDKPHTIVVYAVAKPKHMGKRSQMMAGKGECGCEKEQSKEKSCGCK